ncbi:hypothetical protein KI387_001377 [Taxus chinensis]|uniref:protein-serine/threonine phosphatase n=1 Tax=Taxus chinensis TaxID=29808 RepID=A0AA38LMG3_TAXCH|nr:hypothetical protein KI387_001377 [Taxus chinensis]
MVSPGENDDPMEEIEEGEIADASNEGFDDNDEENLPTLQRKASLNDLAAARYWTEPARREDSPRFLDQGQSGGQWRREGLHYTTSNGNYNPDLYNLAWAQAVQSKPSNSNNGNYNNNVKSKEENLKNGKGVSRSENPGNGRKFVAWKNEECISISSSSSDSADSDDSVRVIRVLPAKSNGSGDNGKKEVGAGNCDNDEKMEVIGGGGDDEKEEGELEEGEIEVRSENSGDPLDGGRDDNKAETTGTSKQGMNFDRGAARHPIGLQKDIHEKKGLKDYHSKKRVAAITEMLKNVTVKDAQKSFTGVCTQLQKALECLIRISTEVHADNVSGIVKQIFSGIRAAYAVYKTGSPKQQEQEKSAFPRLLEFLNTEAQKHFTSKQIKELEAMVLSVSSGNRSLKADTAQREKRKQGMVGIQSSMENTRKPGGERISPNIESEAFSSKPFEGSNNSNEIKTNSKTLEPNEDTQLLVLTESDSRASSNSSLCVGGAESSDGSFKPWEDPEEPDDSNLPTPTHDSYPSCWNQQNLSSSFVERQPSLKSPIPFGRGIQDKTDENAFWPSEPVNAVTYYQEKFGRKTFFSNDRLPSPTPSEDNEEEEASYQGLEVSSSIVGNTHSKQGTEQREVRQINIDKNLYVLRDKYCCPPLNSDVESRGMEPGIQNGSSHKFELQVSQAKDRTDAVETRKLMNSRKALPKSRDPRRRVTESEFCTVDLSSQPCRPESSVILKERVEGILLDRKHQADAEVMQDSYSKRRRNHSAHHLFPNNFPVMMSGSGGWLEENTVIPSSSDWDQSLEMEVESTGALLRPSDLETDCSSMSDADREYTTMENGNLNKRQKTESFYQANTSVSPASETNQLQSNVIDGNLSYKIQSQDEDERRGRLDTDISDQGPQTHTSVNLTSNIIPSVLKDIAVNPTMLMSLLRSGQESLSPLTMQKSEQYQETNPPSASTGAFLPTTGKEMGINPSMLKVFNLQQQVSQGLATSLKPATQIAITGGESRKHQMKPRDPRRVLPINSGCEDSKLNGMPKSCSPVSREIRVTSSRPAAVDLAPKLPQVSCLPNIEQNFKEKLVTIAEMLGKSDVKTLQALSSQLCIDKSKKESECLDLDSTPGRLSKFYEVDNKQDMGVSSPVSSPMQSLSDENIGIAQNKSNPWGDLDHLLEGYSEDQRLAIHQERARRIEEQNKMFHAKKLCLVLDLDHTLLNSAKFVEVDPVHEEILRKKEEQDRERPHRHLFRFPHMGMWTKLRPGIWNFLDRASKLYELHVYTMGNKVYATEMARVLDPTGTLFAGRVISKGDEADVDGDDRPPKSKDLDGVLGMESAVVIIDDSARVWPHHRHNLIVVERYMYFPCSRRQFGLAGQSLLEADVDERAEDGTLASSLAVIEKIHHTFFSSKLLHEVDVRDFLAAEQRKILMGCKVVFSRVFPVGEAQPHLHPLWQIAEQFGAVCKTQIDDEVTHVVALSPGTDKVNWALQTGRWVVHPGWLEASALLYRRANEIHYSIIMAHYPPQ